jgi:3-hydroxyacyl-[acyl-carrier-protein] dehydratase
MASAAADPGILERVKTIIRRDLKLGADIDIADDMPFFQSEVDLDSLDMLLLVTSIEKEFGIKIANEAVGRQVFESVATLAAYITQQLGHRGVATASTGPAPGADALQRLPHQPPFRFVSRVTQIKAGESAEGVWQVNGDEPFFAGHFPGNPLVPGVLIAEALAQLAGVIAPESGAGGKLAHVDVRFDRPVAPPAQIHLHAQLTRSLGPLQLFDVIARVGDATVARGALALHRSDGTAS